MHIYIYIYSSIHTNLFLVCSIHKKKHNYLFITYCRECNKRYIVSNKFSASITCSRKLEIKAVLCTYCHHFQYFLQLPVALFFSFFYLSHYFPTRCDIIRAELKFFFFFFIFFNILFYHQNSGQQYVNYYELRHNDEIIQT